MRGFKRPLLRGLAGILPALLTIFIIIKCYQFLNDFAGGYVNQTIEWVARGVGAEPILISTSKFIGEVIGESFAFGEEVEEEIPADDPEKAPVTVKRFRFTSLMGLIFSVVLIYFFGLLISSFMGKRVLPRVEKMILRVPFVRAIYPHAKQLTDFFFSEYPEKKYRAVVALEYPRRGIYQLGLVTNVGMKDLCDRLGKRMLLVFVPTSPTPVTGYTVIVPEEDVVVLKMPLEDAFRLIVSGGVILPEQQKIPGSQVIEIPPAGLAPGGKEDEEK